MSALTNAGRLGGSLAASYVDAPPPSKRWKQGHAERGQRVHAAQYAGFVSMNTWSVAMLTILAAYKFGVARQSLEHDGR